MSTQEQNVWEHLTLTSLNFQPLEVVSRYRDPQPQVVDNYLYLFNLGPKNWCLNNNLFPITVVYLDNKKDYNDYCRD